MRGIRIVGSLLALGMLSACTFVGVGNDIDKIRTAEATGDLFTRKLTEEYRQIALFEADEMYDWIDAGHFARKGLRAAAGEAVEPETIESRNLPADHVGELTSARAEMVGLLDANGRTRFANLAGHAQGRFDCWIEQQEENIQPEHIAACRDAFYAGMEKLKAAMAPKPAPKKAEPAPPPAMAPETFLVLFAFDSDQLTAAGETVLDNVVQAIKKAGAKELAVTGHADRAGPEEYNLGLSLRRANSVLDGLAGRGIDPAGVSVAGRGEAEPAVETPDGVAEAANRRVEIIVLP